MSSSSSSFAIFTLAATRFNNVVRDTTTRYIVQRGARYRRWRRKPKTVWLMFYFKRHRSSSSSSWFSARVHVHDTTRASADTTPIYRNVVCEQTNKRMTTTTTTRPVRRPVPIFQYTRVCRLCFGFYFVFERYTRPVAVYNNVVIINESSKCLFFFLFLVVVGFDEKDENNKSKTIGAEWRKLMANPTLL